jgi:hypothetical protein
MIGLGYDEWLQICNSKDVILNSNHIFGLPFFAFIILNFTRKNTTNFGAINNSLDHIAAGAEVYLTTAQY